MIAQVIIGGPDGRARREGTFLARPSVGGSTHSISKRGRKTDSRNSAGYQPLRMRAGGIDNSFTRAGCIDAVLQSLSAKFSPISVGVGSLIPGLRRALQPRKQSRSGVSQGFQVSIPFCRFAGLVGCFDRHEATKEKFPHDGKTGTRSGNLAARKRNAC